MIIDGLLAAEPHLHIASQVFEAEKYVHLTDDIMPQIEASTDLVSLNSCVAPAWSVKLILLCRI